MGLILDTESKILGVEIRRESIGLCDLQRKPYGPGDTRPTPRDPEGGVSAHIFAYADGEIEITKEYLRELIAFFNQPENAKYLEE